MGSIFSVVWQGVISPVTTLIILSIVWIWVKLFLQEWDPRHFTVSYADCVQRKQYWRAILAPLSHSSLVILLFNACTIWNFRHIEHQYGLFFFLRYSIVLCIMECVFTSILVHYSIKLAMGPVVRQTLSNLSTMGSSGLILAWVAFQSIVYTSDEPGKYFVLLGIFNIHPTIAPIIMITMYYMFLPHTHALSNLTGLTSGYLLAGGLLQFLPGFYWSFCFLLNVALIVAASVIFRDNNSMTAVDSEEENENILEVIEIGPLPRMLGGTVPSSHDLRDLLQRTERNANDSPMDTVASRMEEGVIFDREEGEAAEETESTPLLPAVGSDRNSGGTGMFFNRSRGPPAVHNTASSSNSNQNPTSASSGGGYLSHLLEGGSSTSARHAPLSPQRPISGGNNDHNSDAEEDSSV